jgi:hypothetical protein
MAFHRGRIVREGEADAGDRRRRDERRQHVHAGKQEAFQGPGAKLGQHVRVGAKLVVGEEVELELAACLGLDLLGRLAQVDVEGMRRRHVRADLEGVLGGVGVTERQRHRDGGTACDGRETATRDALGHVCPLPFLLVGSAWFAG